MSTASISFPQDFLWGAATAAHQIEGNNVNSDWWVREHSPHNGLKEPSGDACDSYTRFAEDIAILAKSGLKVYRFSIEWARIEPEEDFWSRAQLLHYRAMIDECLRQGIEPMVTLNHLTLPRWFAAKGGWRSPESTKYFSRYVSKVLPILHGIHWVCTINEPNMVSLTHGGAEGSNMTASALPQPDPVISEALIRAHRAARELLSSIDGLKSGWSIAAQAFHAMPGCEREMLEYQYPREDLFWQASQGDDYIGVQAYLRTYIGKDGPLPVADGVEKTLTGWEYFPEALGIAVRHGWEVSGHTPLFVTENGIATDDDSRRIDYTTEALKGLREAMRDGISVLGYLHWSLLDNYEWGSYSPTFGLVAVDPMTFARQPKPSLSWLGAIAKSGRVEI
ncbi:MAG: family 1 glycosylhydrolase [Bifidobacterium sp.]|uniref:beta-glucosidase n=1 Tax=Bifidobacterium fermentum TaxID=3059035 RepID=A0AB39UAE9_9BIFI